MTNNSLDFFEFCRQLAHDALEVALRILFHSYSEFLDSLIIILTIIEYFHINSYYESIYSMPFIKFEKFR